MDFKEFIENEKTVIFYGLKKFGNCYKLIYKDQFSKKRTKCIVKIEEIGPNRFMFYSESGINYICDIVNENSELIKKLFYKR